MIQEAEFRGGELMSVELYKMEAKVRRLTQLGGGLVRSVALCETEMESEGRALGWMLLAGAHRSCSCLWFPVPGPR